MSLDRALETAGDGSHRVRGRIKDNAINATAFKDIKAPPKPDERPENETQKGLRIQDKGFLNTAVMQSTITYIDGDAGSTWFSRITEYT